MPITKTNLARNNTWILCASMTGTFSQIGNNNNKEHAKLEDNMAPHPRSKFLWQIEDPRSQQLQENLQYFSVLYAENVWKSRDNDG